MFDLHTLTVFHTALSLLMLLVGFPLVFGLSTGRALPATATVFIVLAVLTAATGFLFPFVKFLPSHAFSVIALVTLAGVIYARYAAQLRGVWRPLYAAGLVFNLYLDVFVGIVQAFLKVPALHAIAPTMDAPAFAVAQGIALLLFIVIGITSVRGLRRALDGGGLPLAAAARA